MIRNPLEVARSLAERDRACAGIRLKSWLHHILDAEFKSRKSTRTFISYANFMSDWMQSIKASESEIGIDLSERTPDVQAKVNSLIDQDLRHHDIDEKTLAFECR